METSFIIVSAILVALISVPFFLINSLGKSGTRKLKSIYKKLALQHNMNTTVKEGWGDSFIGIDGAQKKMIFLKLHGSELEEEFVNLFLAKGCEVKETKEVIRTNHSRETILVRVDLVISFGSGRDPLVLNFYDRDHGFVEDYEHDRAERWKKIITEAVSLQSIPQRAA